VPVGPQIGPQTVETYVPQWNQVRRCTTNWGFCSDRSDSMNHSTLGRDLMALFIEARDGDEQTVPRELGGFLGAGEEET